MFHFCGHNTIRAILELAFYHNKLSHLIDEPYTIDALSQQIKEMEQISDVRYFALYPPSVDFLAQLGVSIQTLQPYSVHHLKVFYEEHCFLELHAHDFNKRENIHILVSEKLLKKAIFEQLLFALEQQKSLNLTNVKVINTKTINTEIINANVINIITQQKHFDQINTSPIIDFHYDYQQYGLTAKVLLQGINAHQSQQIFLADGSIIAFLPLGEQFFQVVWAINKKTYNEIFNEISNENKNLVTLFNSLWDLKILKDLEIRCEQKPHHISDIGVWPLIAKRYESDDAILLGDAHQTVHPLAGQGFNIALQEVAILMKIVNKYTKSQNITAHIKQKIMVQYHAQCQLNTIQLADNIHKIWLYTKKGWLMLFLIKYYQKTNDSSINNVNNLNNINKISKKINVMILKQVFGS